MPFDRFLIAPFKTGLETDLRPFMIMDDAFEFLENAYAFRGRATKRDGTILMNSNPLLSRLRINIGTVTTHAIPGGLTQLQIGQAFSVGNDLFTIYELGAAALTLSTNPGATATINTTTDPNTVTFIGETGTSTVYYYPAEPVMGLDQYDINAINNHPSYAFDLQFAYVYIPNQGWQRSGSGTTPIWHGDNLNFFWTANWQGNLTLANTGIPVFFVSNFNFTLGAGAPMTNDDPIWFTPNGGVGSAATWYPLNATTQMFGTGGANSSAFYFLPSYSGTPQPQFTGPYIWTALLIIPFQGHLVLLNTVENNNSSTTGSGTATQYKNRARWSFRGSPFARNAWYEGNTSDSNVGGTAVNNNNIGAGGGFADATTQEAIVGAEFIKDHLMVYFERSTWELVYTGNEILPFIWQRLNTELGSQSTYSTVPFDKEVLAIGNTGIHACNGSNVIRIDDNIPEKIFDFKIENNDTLRTHGIRDYYHELVYWAFVDVTEQVDNTYPNKVLVYNYANKSWAVNDDCFTCFGYFEQQQDTTWASSAPQTWQNFPGTWSSGVLQANQRQILAGTPEGFVLIIDDDEARNAPSMQITNIAGTAGIVELTIVNHNLTADPTSSPYDQDYILIENVAGDVATIQLNGKIFQVYSVIDVDTILIELLDMNDVPFIIGTYTGDGTAARVSNIQMRTKQFNPYDKQNRNVYLHKVDFNVVRTVDNFTPNGPQIMVDYAPSSADISLVADGQATNSIMGTSVLETGPYDPIYYPLEQEQDRLSHPVYFQSSGTVIQLKFYMTDKQMRNTVSALADFELDAMTLYCQPTDSRME